MVLIGYKLIKYLLIPLPDSDADSPSQSTEIRNTVVIGNMLGFDVDEESPVLKEAFGEAGECSQTLNVVGCWGDVDYGFEQDSKRFSVIETIKSRYFIVVLGNFAGINGLTGFVNVYGPRSEIDKLKVWDELLALKNSKTATWIFMGDFNVVRRPEERISSIFCTRSANDFNHFIRSAELADLKMGGQRFTYFKTQGAKLSKLDRFLVCSSFLSISPLASCFAMERDLSDHSPIILRARCDDFGPPPFKLFNSWMTQDGFNENVRNACSEFVGYGYPDMMFMNKLKHLKKVIKSWKFKTVREENKMMVDLKKRMAEIELVVESRQLSEAVIEERVKGGIEIVECARITALDLKQRARLKWKLEGDDNSRFFHGYVKNRNRKNHIHGIMVNGRGTTEPTEIKTAAATFFKEKFHEVWINRPKFHNPGFRILSDCDARFLEGEFSLDEIRNAIWSGGGGGGGTSRQGQTVSRSSSSKNIGSC
ncbi:uncharacterized protein LOC128132721 [Lactuca sativa]|uniref:uncharacterized protein LOC128132721 n=1 Tax=Lactuca sativa TaxID=4236 RepID=UPI0022AEEF06|nr:uncharacterized protein LOC128132721 [Lactuca sativa]